MVEVRRASHEEHRVCQQIRREVFVEGQNVPLEDDLDGLDELAQHYLAFADGRAVGNARLRKISDATAKIERVAVLEAYRGRGIGDALMAHVERVARSWSCQEVVLNAQISVVQFYQRRGYVGEGEVFLDAAIEHLHMRLTL